MSKYADWMDLQKKIENSEEYLRIGRMQRIDFIRDYRIAIARAVMTGKLSDDKLRDFGYSPQEIHEIKLTVNWIKELGLK